MRKFQIRRPRLVDRDSVLARYCEGKSVLHLGCADAPYTKDRLESGTLLHTKLASVARHIVGLDLDGEAIHMLREIGIRSVKTGDAERLSDFEGGGQQYDVVVAGEILEHLPNPGLCLRGAKTALAPQGMIVVSVPNAFSLKCFLRFGLRTELVHEDHVCYYSPATLSRLALLSGLSCQIVGFYSSHPQHRFKRTLECLLFGWARALAPQWAEGFVAVLKPVDVAEVA